MTAHDEPSGSALDAISAREPAPLKHEWVQVIVTSPRTERETRRFLEGERKVIKKLDLTNAEDVRSVAVMCAACKFAPQSPEDMTLIDCPGAPE